MKGKVGASDLYVNVKVYLCCKIIAHYGLDANPLHAAFPGTARQGRCGERAAYNDIPERFLLLEDEDLEAAVAGMLGIEGQS